MQKEKVKTVVIFLLCCVFVFHSVEKKEIIDELKENNLFLIRKAKLADSLVRDTILRGLELAERLAVKEKKIEEYENNKHKVVVTMYHPVVGQTDDTPNITADGSVIKIKKASEYRYVAVSRNMLMRYGGFLMYGDYVWIEAGKKSGVYQVRDTMAARWINRIDILESPGVEPYKYNNGSLRRIDYEVSTL